MPTCALPPRRTAVATALVLAALLLVPSAAPAITGGRPASSQDVPWLVWIRGCGGTLVAPDRVLTAAHCVDRKVPQDVGRVRVDGAPRLDVRVTGISSHPRWSSERFATLADGWARHDVALLRIAPPVTGVAPVRLGRARAGQALTVVGRGKRDPDAGIPDPRTVPALHGTTLRTLTDGACERFWRGYREGQGADFDGALMVCGRDRRADGRDERGICQGDSGGPALVRAPGGALRQVGVASMGTDRCGEGPSVFTELAAVRPFLDRREPAWAPVPAGAPTLGGTPAVGSTLTCAPPAWTIAPTRVAFAFTTFRFGEGVRVLQRGPSPDYVVRPADAGRRIGCRVVAATDGGEVTPASDDVAVPAG